MNIILQYKNYKYYKKQCCHSIFYITKCIHYILKNILKYFLSIRISMRSYMDKIYKKLEDDEKKYIDDIRKANTNKFINIYEEWNEKEEDKYYNEYISLLEKLNLDVKTINKIVVQINKKFSNRFIYMIFINALKYVLEYIYLKKNMKSISSNYYPNVYDEKFNNKINSKTEFNQCFMMDDSDNSQFTLTKTQQFLKNYISPLTPYNNLLIYHETGVGKTCTMISIIEQFKEIINDRKNIINSLYNKFDNYYQNKRDNQAIHIIIPKGFVKEKYQKEIHNVTKKLDQCTNLEYIQKDSNLDNSSYKKFLYGYSKKKGLFDEYYKLSSIDLFRKNYIKIEKTVLTSSQLYNKPELWYFVKKKILGQIYNNIIYVFDEVHRLNQKNSGSDNKFENKILTKFIKSLIKYSGNIKLLFLTATPMFHNYEEFLFIMNIFLINDSRPKISLYEKKILKTYVEGKKVSINQVDIIFNRISTGYISYLSSDKTEIPCVLSPKIIENLKILDTKKIRYTKAWVKNKNIRENEKLSKLCIVISYFTGLQKKIYNKTVKKVSETTIQQTSNITYPSNIKHSDIFKVVDKTEILYSVQRSTTKILDIYSLKNLENYSTKIHSIINLVKNSIKQTGLIFIYSRYKVKGIIDIALALELNNVAMRYHKNSKSIIKNQKIKNKAKYKYVILTGDTPIKTRQEIYNACFSKDNISKGEIKIILGTQILSEGWDMKAIRSIHILEPWWNISTLKQIIGRGIRKGSHTMLSKEEQNIIIYLHGGCDKNSTKESIDLYMYRRSVLEFTKISKIEKYIKKNAIDNNFNWSRNNQKINIKEKCTIKNKIYFRNKKFEYKDFYIFEDCWFKNEQEKKKLKLTNDNSTFYKEFLIGYLKYVYMYLYKYFTYEVNNKYNKLSVITELIIGIKKFYKYPTKLVEYCVKEIITYPRNYPIYRNQIIGFVKSIKEYLIYQEIDNYSLNLPIYYINENFKYVIPMLSLKKILI